MSQLAVINKKIANLPPDQKQEILDLLTELDEAKKKEQSKTEFLPFVERM